MTKFLVLAVLVPWCVALSVIDLRCRRLPNALTLSGAVVLLALSAVTGRGFAGLIGAVLLAGCYLLVFLVRPAAMGAGDVKLALGLGAASGTIGAQSWVWTALAAPILTAALGVVWLCWRRRRDPPRIGAHIPHGPAMCLSAVAAIALTG